MKTTYRIAFALAAALPLATLPAVAARAGATPKCFGREATIVGTEERDELLGTPGDDVIVGLGAGDDISGGGGDDLICGFGEGASGARDKQDELYGGPGDDRIDGGKGADYQAGGNGKDLLVGGGTGTIWGDSLEGGPGDDVLRGSDGGEYLDPGGGDDLVSGGEGGDLIDLLSSPRGLRVSMERGTARGEGLDRFSGVEQVIGSDHDDVLLGGPGDEGLEGAGGDDLVRGGGGNDYLNADRMDYGPLTDQGGGNDVVIGGPGNDGLIAGNGDDRLDGGAGRDSFGVYGSGQKTIRAGSQNGQTLEFFHGPVEADLREGTATIGGEQPGSVSFDEIQNLYGSPQSDVLVGDGRRNVLWGTPTIYGLDEGPAGGDDVIRGLAGDDEIEEKDGDSEIYGGPGDDRVRAFAGADVISGGPGDDDITSGYFESSEHPDGDEVSGDGGNDVIRGGEGDDVLDGGAGNDEVDGGIDDDRLEGGEGNDSLDGGDGTDVCAGGESTRRCEDSTPLAVPDAPRASPGTSSSPTPPATRGLSPWRRARAKPPAP